MRYPFDRVEGGRQRALIGLTAFTLIALVGLSVIDRQIQTSAAPAGQVSLQLAGNNDTASEIVASWETGRSLHMAGASVGLDFMFLTAYGLTLAFAGSRVAYRGGVAGREKWVTMGGIAAWSGIVAAALDAVEGVLLLVLIGDPAAGPAPAIMAIAVAKFALIGLALVVILGGLLSSRPVRRVQASGESSQ